MGGGWGGEQWWGVWDAADQKVRRPVMVKGRGKENPRLERRLMGGVH